MSLNQEELEQMERVIYKNTNEFIEALMGVLTRLQGRLEALESSSYSGVARIEERIEASRQVLADELVNIRDEVRETVRSLENVEREDSLDLRAEF